MDVDFQHVWLLVLSLGGMATVAAFTTAKFSTALSAQRRRLLFAVAALLAFGTAVALGLTGIFFVLFSGYCEDVGFCAPTWWVFVGLFLFGVAIVLGGLMGKAIREYRRVAREGEHSRR
jgi:uncharacterized membrane protein SpoIIM required for sporulation